MFSINDILITSSQVIAEVLNKFVVSIGLQLSNRITSSTSHMDSMVNSILIPDIISPFKRVFSY